MIYIFENTLNLDENFLERVFPLLSVQRQKKVERYKMLSDKINGCLGFLLLRYALKNEFGIYETPEFIFGEYEKPFLKNYKNIFFNISHCKNAVVCAVSNKNIAVDIMDFRKVNDLVINRVCSSQEQKFIYESADSDMAFIRLWVMKECFAKLDGRGLSLDFSKITEELEECKNIKYIETKGYILGYTKIDNDRIISLNGESIIKGITERL